LPPYYPVNPEPSDDRAVGCDRPCISETPIQIAGASVLEEHGGAEHWDLRGATALPGSIDTHPHHLQFAALHFAARRSLRG
jgi:cytosine/adenosine deaminase-related metal-dependent hydrolase